MGTDTRTCTGGTPAPGRGAPWRAVTVVSAFPWGRRSRTAVSSMILFLFGGLQVTRGCRACCMSCITGIL